MSSRMLKPAVMILALCSPAWARVPQEKTSPPAQGHGSTGPAAKITIRGCVSGGKRYTFMQASTGAIFELNGETDRLVSAEGKLVEITANELSPRPDSELPMLRVNRLRVVSDKCPIHASSTPVNSRSADQGYSPMSPNTGPYTDPGTVSQIPPNVNNPNISGSKGAPSAGTGNPPKPPQP
jgi:hypothetical protein